jgi:hypothetical protein
MPNLHHCFPRRRQLQHAMQLASLRAAEKQEDSAVAVCGGGGTIIVRRRLCRVDAARPPTPLDLTCAIRPLMRKSAAWPRKSLAPPASYLANVSGGMEPSQLSSPRRDCIEEAVSMPLVPFCNATAEWSEASSTEAVDADCASLDDSSDPRFAYRFDLYRDAVSISCPCLFHNLQKHAKATPSLRAGRGRLRLYHYWAICK